MYNNITIQKKDVNSYFEGHWNDFYSHFLEIKSTAGKWHKCLCPLHDDSDPSLSFNRETGAFKCFGCDASGDSFRFYGLLKSVSDFPEILKGIGQEFGINGSVYSPKKSSRVRKNDKKRIVATYDYTDKKGELLFQVVRFQPKDFRQRRPDGKGGFIWNMDGVQRVLYNLGEILQAELVVICEGEKDSENVTKELGFTATTCPGGAEKWKDEYSATLEGKKIILLPDHDEAGIKHVQKIASSLNGVAESIKILELPGLAQKGDVSDWIEAGGTKEKLEQLIAECPPWEPKEDPEEATKRLFPRGPFPWEVLPPSIAQSLKQLARSCASSPTSLPGASVSIIASVLGSMVSVSPKESWEEPLIFWMCDIRPSGSGKTPVARALCRVLYKAQSEADEAYKQEVDDWESLSKEDRGSPPARVRGYFVTNLTLEGLREDHSGHGGKVCILDELSAFISSQNQYKAKGSDRESWLSLHDGQPARVVRAGKSVTLSGARISMFGGIQPQVWKKSFKSEDDLYLVDGTVFRFLPVYEGSAFFPLTAEAWSDENREAWESLLKTAMKWSDRQQEAKEKKILCLNQEAQQAFIDWRNELVIMSGDLPMSVRGFIPKLVGYALRLAGVFYLMDVFSRDQEPGSVLRLDDINRGIRVSAFYLGHIMAAMEAIASENIPEVLEITGQMIHLAKTLEALKSELDNGRLAVGYICDRFNENCSLDLKVRSSRSMGSLIRSCGLTILLGKRDFHDKRRVRCFKWDEKTNSFIERCLQSLQSLQNEENQKVTDGDNLFKMSPKSPFIEKMETMETSQNRSLHVQGIDNITNGDNGDNGDIVSKVDDKITSIFDLNPKTKPAEQSLDWRF